MKAAQLKPMTVEQKTLRVFNDMAKKKFTSIEAACKAYKFAPASYYLHVKNIKRIEALASAGIRSEAELPTTPTTANKWADEVEALRKENTKLKNDFEAERLRSFRLERKLVNLILGEASV